MRAFAVIRAPFYLACCLLLALSSPLAARPVIDLYLPASTPFWDRVERFAQAAAEDMEVQLRVFDANRSRRKMLNQFSKSISSQQPPDAVLFPNYLETAPILIKDCEAAEIPCILFNSGLSEADAATLGEPGEHYRYWIAQLLPDDYQTTRELTHLLLQEARQLFPNQPWLDMVALTGYGADAPSRVRIQAVLDEIADRPDVNMAQIFFTDWSREDAATRTSGMLPRYPEVRAIWSSNYRTTEGILDGLAKEGKRAGHDLVVNSFDIDPPSLAGVADGTLAATAGGHYAEGAWAVILMADHLTGHPLPAHQRVINTRQLIVTRDNVKQVRRVLEYLEQAPQCLNKIDFSLFSRPQGDYDFRLQPVLELLEQRMNEVMAENHDG
ncbi:MAG: ABC transporter substrate-binding protein [Marinobacter sp.]|nr:ABC transporter substrate-binding protein [Marinobacter sp.]